MEEIRTSSKSAYSAYHDESVEQDPFGCGNGCHLQYPDYPREVVDFSRASTASNTPSNYHDAVKGIHQDFPSEGPQSAGLLIPPEGFTNADMLVYNAHGQAFTVRKPSQNKDEASDAFGPKVFHGLSKDAGIGGSIIREAVESVESSPPCSPKIGGGRRASGRPGSKEISGPNSIGDSPATPGVGLQDSRMPQKEFSNPQILNDLRKIKLVSRVTPNLRKRPGVGDAHHLLMNPYEDRSSVRMYTLRVRADDSCSGNYNY